MKPSLDTNADIYQHCKMLAISEWVDKVSYFADIAVFMSLQNPTTTLTSIISLSTVFMQIKSL